MSEVLNVRLDKETNLSNQMLGSLDLLRGQITETKGDFHSGVDLRRYKCHRVDTDRYFILIVPRYVTVSMIQI